MVEKSVYNSKEYLRFKDQLSQVDVLFDKAREWADLSNSLIKIVNIINKNPGLPVPNKKELAKRLTQCLNPDLSVIHSQTLEVFVVIFAREISLKLNEADLVVWGADLGLFYSGLFNFYQYAAYDNKKQFLKIMQEQMLKLKKELIVSLPGFMMCMLPALDDQNSEMTKQVEQILTETEKIVGTSKFFGEIWKCMMRTPRCRVSSMKYLSKKIPKTPQQAQDFVRTGRVILSPYQMIIKLGCVVLEDEKQPEVPDWYTYELKMIHDLDVSASIEAYFYFYYPNKEVMVNNALLAGLSTVNQSVYANRAVLDFMLSHMPITSQINSDKEAINLMEGALMTLVKKDFASLKKFFHWFLEHLSYSNKLPQADDPAIRFVNPALKTIFRKFYKVQTDSKITINDQGVQVKDLWTISTPILIFMNLLSDNLQTIAEPILSEISVDLIKYIQHFYKPEEQLDHQYRDLMQKFSGACANLFQMIAGHMDCVYKSLGNLLEYEIKLVANSGHKMESIDLITFCIRDLTKITEHNTTKDSKLQRVKLVTPILQGLLSGIEMLAESENYALSALKLIEEILDMVHEDSYVQQLYEPIQIFNNFFIKLSQNFDRRGYQVYKISSDILVKIQRLANPETFLHNTDWFCRIIQCSCDTQSNIKQLLVSIEAFLDIFQKSQENYRNLNQLTDLISKESKEKIVETLWKLLNEPEDHERIVSVLKRMDKLMPKIFSEVITQDIISNDRKVKYQAVTKFSIFWKLTANDYPSYKPFEPISERMEKYQSENVSDGLPIMFKNLSLGLSLDEERAYNALHKMLEILEDRDPTMRLSCRSWLSESKHDYHRILDPILNEFLENKKLLVSFTGQCFFMESYNATTVIQNFSKLRNIILNTQDEMIKYVVTQDTSNYLRDKGRLPTDFKQNLPEHLRKMELKLSNGKYVQTIVYITLQFIMGQAVESLNQEMYQETQTVNASAAEFMELILKSLQPYKDLAHEVAHVIINPVISTLRQSIENRNVAQQVHILNLLKVILFECNFHSKFQSKSIRDYELTKYNTEKLFKESVLVMCIRDGMLNESSYVRNAFVQFADVVLPFIQAVIKPEEMKIHATMMLQCYCNLLTMVDMSGNNSKQKNKARQFTITQETDVITIIKGFENLLDNCLGIKREKDISEEIEDQLKDLKGVANDKSGGWFWFAGSKEVVVPSDPNENLKKEIWGPKNTENLLLSCLQIWNGLEIFYFRDYYFTRLGIFPYNKSDDSQMEKFLLENMKNKHSFEKNDGVAQQLKHTKSQESGLQDFRKFIGDKLNITQTALIDMLTPICQVYVQQIIDGFLQIWRQSKVWNQTEIQASQGCDRIIQMLLCLKIEPYKIVEAVNRWIVKNNCVCAKEKKQVILNKENKNEFCVLQSLLCQFLYVYFVQSVSNHFKSGNHVENTSQLYKHVAQFIRNFYLSKHPTTVLWLLEIIFIVQNKFRPDDNKADKRIKYEFHELLDTLLRSCADILTDQFNVVYSTNYGFDGVALSPTVYEFLKRYEFIKQKSHENKKLDELRSTVSYLRFDQKTLEKFDEIPFQKESIFQSLDQVRKIRKQNSRRNELSLFMKELNQNLEEKPERPKNFNILQQEVFKYFTILTLKQILLRVVTSIYVNDEQDKVSQSLSIIVNSVLKILNSQIKQVEVKDQEIAVRNKIQCEVFSDFLAVLTHENAILQKEYRLEITALFNSDNFFLLSKRTLRKWQQIMRNFMSNDINHEVFDDLLLKFNKVEGLFVSKKWEISQKSLTFKRLAFLVFSSSINSLGVTQLDMLLKKMTEGFKNANKDGEMSQQLFLLSRILMIRLETNALAEALRKLWPHLLNELVNVFDGKCVGYQLQIEGIKIVELMSQLNIEDFQMNQWMFLFDGYGLNIGVNHEQMKREDDQQIKQEFVMVDNDVGKVFQPYLAKFICNKTTFARNDIDKRRQNQLMTTYIVDRTVMPTQKPKDSPNPNISRQTAFEPIKKDPDVNEEILLEDCAYGYAYKLQQSLTDANVELTEIDRRNAEVLIERDFLSKPRN